MAETSLAVASAQRKERLNALKKRRAGEADGANGVEQTKTFVFKQRNFDQESRQVRKRPRTLANGSVVYEDVDEDDEREGDVSITLRAGQTVEDAVRGLAERIVKEDEKKRAEELDLLNIAPKRANWDLKRDMEKRTRKLERQTREAYLFLFRQRLQSIKSASSNGTSKNPSSGSDLLAGMQAAENENRERMRMVDVEAEENEME